MRAAPPIIDPPLTPRNIFPQSCEGTNQTEKAAIPTIIHGPNRQNPISFAALATITSVREKTVAEANPQPTARNAFPLRTPGCNPTNATPAVPSMAPIQRWGATPPGKKSAPKSAVISTLVPRIGVATETSPPAKARKVAICPKKKSTEPAGAASQIHTDSPGGGSLAQNKSGKENRAIARLHATMACRGGWPASIDLFNSNAPIA